MTTFEITIIVLLAAIVVLLIVLLRTAIEGFRGVWQNQDTMYQDIQRIEVNTHHASSVLQDKIIPDIERLLSDILVLKAYFNGLLERLDNMTDEGGTLQQQLNDLAINVKGNYNTLEQQQEDLLDVKKGVPALFDEIGQINAIIGGFIPMLKKLLEHNESIENFWASDSSLVIKLLKELVDIEHKSDERNDNMFPFMQEIMRNYNPPCYAPDGICTNPFGDCINRPKRGTGGTLSTSTNKIKED